MRIDNILAFIDVDIVSQRVIERTAWLAEKFGANVELFSTVFDQFVDSDEGMSNVVDEHRKRLEALATRMSSRGILVTMDVAWAASADDAFLKKIWKSKPDLIAKQTHGRSLIDKVLLTNEDWNLVSKAQKPLLLVRDRPIAEQPTIMAAVDPMHEHDKPAALDRRILDIAASLSKATGAKAHAVHVVETAAALVASTATVEPAFGAIVASGADSAAAEVHREQLGEKAGAAFEELLKDHGTEGIQSELLEGNVPTELLQHADKLNADFVVMGAVSRGMLESTMIGHTAKPVLNELDCDLIIVK